MSTVPNVAVTGPKVLLKALEQQWKENGLPPLYDEENIEERRENPIYNALHSHGAHPGSVKYTYHSHTSGVDRIYELPQDWNQVAGIGKGYNKAPEVVIEGYQAEMKPGSVSFGCRTVPNEVFTNLSQYIQEYDLEISRDGEDLTEGITEIAEAID